MNDALTPYGKLIRLYRMAYQIRTFDMAKAGGCGSAALHSMEMGRIPVDLNILNKIITGMEIDKDIAIMLITAAHELSIKSSNQTEG